MNEGTPTNEHLKELKVLDDKLASIGAPVSLEDQAIFFFVSLQAYFMQQEEAGC